MEQADSRLRSCNVSSPKRLEGNMQWGQGETGPQDAQVSALTGPSTVRNLGPCQATLMHS